jgi:hypothetical protein
VGKACTIRHARKFDDIGRQLSPCPFALVAVGRNWPANLLSDADPLGTMFLRMPKIRGSIKDAINKAMEQVGGLESPAGQDVRDIAHWLWKRAGIANVFDEWP